MDGAGTNAALVFPVLKLWPLLSRRQLLKLNYIIITVHLLDVVLGKTTRRRSKVTLLHPEVVQTSVIVFQFVVAFDKCSLSCVFVWTSVRAVAEWGRM